MNKHNFKYWPWLVLVGVLCLGAASVTSLQRHSDWDNGSAGAGGIWSRSAAAPDRAGMWTQQLNVATLTVTNLVIPAGENFFYAQSDVNGSLVWSNNGAGRLLFYNTTANPDVWQSAQGFEMLSLYVTNTATLNGAVTLNTKATYLNTTIAGAGNGNTNYTLLSGRTMYLGSSNVNILAVMDYPADTATEFASASITNLSASTWGISFSSVTNRLFFAGTYGTNAPTVLTNDTRLELSIKSQGTNTWIGYTYFKPAR